MVRTAGQEVLFLPKLPRIGSLTTFLVQPCACPHSAYCWMHPPMDGPVATLAPCTRRDIESDRERGGGRGRGVGGYGHVASRRQLHARLVHSQIFQENTVKYCMYTLSNISTPAPRRLACGALCSAAPETPRSVFWRSQFASRKSPQSCFFEGIGAVCCRGMAL